MDVARPTKIKWNQSYAKHFQQYYSHCQIYFNRLMPWFMKWYKLSITHKRKCTVWVLFTKQCKGKLRLDLELTIRVLSIRTSAVPIHCIQRRKI